MGYRTIEVDGTTYEYTVGKTHVKVKGVGTDKKENVGKARHEEAAPMEAAPPVPVYSVQPADVVAFIRKNKKTK